MHLHYLLIAHKNPEQVKRLTERLLFAHSSIYIHIDKNALESLKELVTLFKNNGAEVLYYFHPVPYDVLLSREKQFLDFQRTIRDVIGKENVILEFNTRDFKSFTQDDSNYIDHAHLSKKGQLFIADTLLTYIRHW